MSVMRKDFVHMVGGVIPEDMVAVFDDRDVSEEEANERIQSGQQMFLDMAILPKDTFERVFRSVTEDRALSGDHVVDWLLQCEDKDVLRDIADKCIMRVKLLQMRDKEY